MARLIAGQNMEHPGSEVGLLFRVIAKDGREYKVFTDGYTEGFGDDCIVLNYFPILLATARAGVSRG